MPSKDIAPTEAATPTDDIAQIDPKTLEMLVCPLTKTELVWKKDSSELFSYAARLAFPVRKNIPLLFVGEARALTDEELEAKRAGQNTL